jgi:eukaryotic-like serine/threonine-protein kinase
MKECPECYTCYEDEYKRCPKDGQSLFTSHNCALTLSDRYILEKRLGKGGMGTVFKAKHKFLKSAHAIKIISPEVVREDETLLIRFRQEAILAASIHHPNVVAVTDFGVENNDTPYLVMELVEGISLDEFLRRESRLAPEKALEILSPILLGLSEAHGKGITHRDLKPLNVMLKYGRPLEQAVKVLDFGLAKMKSTEMFASLVQAKTTNLLGSPHYMSPEQWANEGVDARADIYSVGIILYQMLAGEVPFKGDSIPNVMYQHLQVEPPSFASFGISISPEIESVVRQALAKDKNRRYSSVEEFLGEYKKALLRSNKQTDPKIQNNDAYPESTDTSAVTDQPFVLNKNTNVDFLKTNEIHYLSSSQNQTLSSYFNKPNSLSSAETQKLAQRFLHAHSQVEEARTRVNEAEKLAQEFNEAQKAAEVARQKVIQAQKRLEQDVRRRIQDEMESRLAVEREARNKAEAEARRLAEEAQARKEAEERANILAKTALEAQRRAEEERLKAEKESQQRQLEEGTRKKAEEAISKLAQEVVDAKRRYEEAKREAENEARFRLEAESKRKKVEEEIQRIKEAEDEKRKIAENQAAQQIKEQAGLLEKQFLDAQKKADEARLLAQSEAKKREQAELAREKAEQEARRLAEEIIEAQKRLEEAQQLAKSESEKRALEEAARKKAESSTQAASFENIQYVDNVNKSFQTLKDNPVKPSSPDLSGETFSEFKSTSPGQILINTSLSEGSHKNEISSGKKLKSLHLVSGILALLVVSGLGSYLIYSQFFKASTNGNTNSDFRGGTNTSNTLSAPSDRLNKKMVQIMGGSFRMGRDDVDPGEKNYGVQYPAHNVKVDTFYIDRTEVTNEEYAEYIQATNRKEPNYWENGRPPVGQEKFPVTQVSYNDAKDFADWISKRENLRCQVPSEEEWEYTARNGKLQTIYPWGDDWIPGRVNIANGDSGVAIEVGTIKDETSVGGIKDMMGNVMEWTSTTFDYYPEFPDSAKRPDINANIFMTVRGLSFAAEKEKMQKVNLLLTYRQGVGADKKYKFLGFRLVCRQQ